MFKTKHGIRVSELFKWNYYAIGLLESSYSKSWTGKPVLQK